MNLHFTHVVLIGGSMVVKQVYQNPGTVKWFGDVVKSGWCKCFPSVYLIFMRRD
jgi:hypothetical protein